MAHVKKYTRANIGHALDHDSRQDGDGVNRSNEKIDKGRTYLNYNLATHGENPIDRINRRTSEVKCLKRDNVNVMCSWMLTLPKDFDGDEKAFFEEGYRFMANRYGEENVISAWVHKDETTPHMHFKFVPVVDGEKGKKVSAKECCNRQDLKTFHVDLKEHLENALQCPCNVLNGATAGGNKAIAQLEAEEAQRLAEALNKRADELSNQVDGLQEDRRNLQQENENLKQENGSLKEENGNLQIENERLASELKNTQDKLLEYESNPKKHLTESKEAYADRVAVGKQAIAIRQRSSELDGQEQRLLKRTADIDLEVERRSSTIAEKKAKTIVNKRDSEARKKAEAEVSRLQQENQLLRQQDERNGKENRLLRELVEDYNEALTGQLIDADTLMEQERFKRQKQKSKGMEH